MTSLQFFRGTLVVLLTLAGAYVLYTGLSILMVLVIAIIIASAVRPLVERLMKWRVPRSFAIVIVYLSLAIIIIALFVAIIPPIVNQVALYVENDARLAFRIIRAQTWVEHLILDVTHEDVSLVAQEDIRTAVSEFVQEIRRSAPSILDDIGTTIGNAVLILVMGMYWLTSHDKAINFVAQLSPPHYRDEVHTIFDEIEYTLGGYVRGVVTISAIVGTLNFTALSLLGVPNALMLAFIIATTTMIPMIGGFLGGGIIVFLTLVTAPEYVLTVFIVFFLITQLENHVLTPRIMGNNVGLDPLLVIIYTAIGFIMYGIVGALIAVPLMGTFHILLTHLIIEPYKDSIKSFSDEAGVPIMRGDGKKEKQTQIEIAN